MTRIERLQHCRENDASITALFMPAWMHFASLQARNWFWCVLSTMQPPLNFVLHMYCHNETSISIACKYIVMLSRGVMSANFTKYIIKDATWNDRNYRLCSCRLECTLPTCRLGIDSDVSYPPCNPLRISPCIRIVDFS